MPRRKTEMAPEMGHGQEFAHIAAGRIDVLLRAVAATYPTRWSGGYRKTQITKRAIARAIALEITHRMSPLRLWGWMCGNTLWVSGQTVDVFYVRPAHSVGHVASGSTWRSITRRMPAEQIRLYRDPYGRDKNPPDQRSYSSLRPSILGGPRILFGPTSRCAST